MEILFLFFALYIRVTFEGKNAFRAKKSRIKIRV